MPKRVGNYDLVLELGHGSFAHVYKGIHISTGERFAVKTISKERIGDRRLQENLGTEIAIMRDIQHPNIVRTSLNKYSLRYTTKSYKTSLRISNNIPQLCRGGDLSSYIKRATYKKLDEFIALSFLKQLCCGLHFLSQSSIIHRDLKPANVLLSESSEYAVLKLADFGFAKHLTEASLAQTQCGSPLYMAPEILENQEYDSKADLWSVGCIFYEMLVGYTPFRGTSQRDLLNNILTKPLTIPNEIPLSSSSLQLLQMLLRIEPTQRISLIDFNAYCESNLIQLHRSRASRSDSLNSVESSNNNTQNNNSSTSSSSRSTTYATGGVGSNSLNTGTVNRSPMIPILPVNNTGPTVTSTTAPSGTSGTGATGPIGMSYSPHNLAIKYMNPPATSNNNSNNANLSPRNQQLQNMQFNNHSSKSIGRNSPSILQSNNNNNNPILMNSYTRSPQQLYHHQLQQQQPQQQQQFRSQSQQQLQQQQQQQSINIRTSNSKKISSNKFNGNNDDQQYDINNILRNLIISDVQIDEIYQPSTVTVTASTSTSTSNISASTTNVPMTAINMLRNMNNTNNDNTMQQNQTQNLYPQQQTQIINTNYMNYNTKQQQSSPSITHTSPAYKTPSKLSQQQIVSSSPNQLTTFSYLDAWRQLSATISNTNANSSTKSSPATLQQTNNTTEQQQMYDPHTDTSRIVNTNATTNQLMPGAGSVGSGTSDDDFVIIDTVVTPATVPAPQSHSEVVTGRPHPWREGMNGVQTGAAVTVTERTPQSSAASSPRSRSNSVSQNYTTKSILTPTRQQSFNSTPASNYFFSQPLNIDQTSNQTYISTTQTNPVQGGLPLSRKNSKETYNSNNHIGNSSGGLYEPHPLSRKNSVRSEFSYHTNSSNRSGNGGDISLDSANQTGISYSPIQSSPLLRAYSNQQPQQQQQQPQQRPQQTQMKPAQLSDKIYQQAIPNVSQPIPIPANFVTYTTQNQQQTAGYYKQHQSQTQFSPLTPPQQQTYLINNKSRSNSLSNNFNNSPSQPSYLLQVRSSSNRSRSNSLSSNYGSNTNKYNSGAGLGTSPFSQSQYMRMLHNTNIGGQSQTPNVVANNNIIQSGSSPKQSIKIRSTSFGQEPVIKRNMSATATVLSQSQVQQIYLQSIVANPPSPNNNNNNNNNNNTVSLNSTEQHYNPVYKQQSSPSILSPSTAVMNDNTILTAGASTYGSLTLLPMDNTNTITSPTFNNTDNNNTNNPTLNHINNQNINDPNIVQTVLDKYTSVYETVALITDIGDSLIKDTIQLEKMTLNTNDVSTASINNNESITNNINPLLNNTTSTATATANINASTEASTSNNSTNKLKMKQKWIDSLYKASRVYFHAVAQLKDFMTPIAELKTKNMDIHAMLLNIKMNLLSWFDQLVIRIDQCKTHLVEHELETNHMNNIMIPTKSIPHVLMEIAENMHQRVTVCEMLGKLEEACDKYPKIILLVEAVRQSVSCINLNQSYNRSLYNDTPGYKLEENAIDDELCLTKYLNSIEEQYNVCKKQLHERKTSRSSSSLSFDSTLQTDTTSTIRSYSNSTSASSTPVLTANTVTVNTVKDPYSTGNDNLKDIQPHGQQQLTQDIFISIPATATSTTSAITNTNTNTGGLSSMLKNNLSTVYELNNEASLTTSPIGHQSPLSHTNHYDNNIHSTNKVNNYNSSKSPLIFDQTNESIKGGECQEQGNNIEHSIDSNRTPSPAFMLLLSSSKKDPEQIMENNSEINKLLLNPELSATSNTTSTNTIIGNSSSNKIESQKSSIISNETEQEQFDRLLYTLSPSPPLLNTTISTTSSTITNVLNNDSNPLHHSY